MVETLWRISSSARPSTSARNTSALRVISTTADCRMFSFFSSRGRKCRTSWAVSTIFWQPSISKLRYAGTRWSGMTQSLIPVPRPRKAMTFDSPLHRKGRGWSMSMILGKSRSRMSPKSFLLISSSTLLIFLKSSTSTPLARSSSRMLFQMASISVCCSRVTRSTSLICASGSSPDSGSRLSGVSRARWLRMPMRTR